MIFRKIRGSRNAWAWLTACAIASSHSDRIGRILGAEAAGAGIADASASSAVSIGSTSLMAAHSR